VRRPPSEKYRGGLCRVQACRSERQVTLTFADVPTLFTSEGLAVGGESGGDTAAGDEDRVSAHSGGAALADIKGAMGDFRVSSQEGYLAGGESHFEDGERGQLGGAGEALDGRA
jgi:hypothetical protein